MYNLKPYFQKSDAIPAEIMYHLPSYHQQTSFTTQCSAVNSLHNNSPLNEFQAKVQHIQQEIVKRLISLQDSLAKLNLNTTHNKQGDSVSTSTSTKTAEFTNFSKRDVPLLKLLQAYAKQHNLVCKIVENKKDEQITVTCQAAGAVPVNPSTLNALKYIGSALGLYPKNDNKSIENVNKWIDTLELHQQITTDTIRKLSRCLSLNDFICTYNTITLADIVTRAFFCNGNTLINWKSVTAPNNIQLWVKRIDELLLIK